MNFRSFFCAVLIMLAASAIFSSCDILESDEFELTPVFDCPTLMLNVRDTCITGNGETGEVDGDCNCPPRFDCPDLQLDFGAPCTNAAGENGNVSQNCECIPNVTFDCPDLQLDFEAPCTNAAGENGNISQNCECI